MSISSPRLTPEQVAASRESQRQYEANMAISGMYMTDKERAFFKQLNDEAVGYEEGVQRTFAWLKEQGIIPVSNRVLPWKEVAPQAAGSIPSSAKRR